MHMICAGNDRWLGGCKWMSAGGLQRDWIQLYALVLGPARKNKHFGNNSHFLESEPLRHGLSHQTSDVNHGAGANKKKTVILVKTVISLIFTTEKQSFLQSWQSESLKNSRDDSKWKLLDQSPGRSPALMHLHPPNQRTLPAHIMCMRGESGDCFFPGF